MLEFVDEIEPLGDEWALWAGEHHPSPIWLARVHTSDLTDRAVGTFVTPADVVLGLRGWDDADEGAGPAPFALFDIEKFVRMMLHQSGLAFEALASANVLNDTGFPAHEIADAAVTAGILGYYRDVTAPLLAGKGEGWRWRTLLTGALLARDGVVSQSMATLIERLGVGAEPGDAPQIESLRAMLQTSVHLPATPSNYDMLNDFVVEARLRTS